MKARASMMRQPIRVDFRDLRVGFGGWSPFPGPFSALRSFQKIRAKLMMFAYSEENSPVEFFLVALGFRAA